MSVAREAVIRSVLSSQALSGVHGTWEEAAGIYDALKVRQGAIPCIRRYPDGSRCEFLAAKEVVDDCGVCMGQDRGEAFSTWPMLATWKHRHYRCAQCRLKFAVSA